MARRSERAMLLIIGFWISGRRKLHSILHLRAVLELYRPPLALPCLPAPTIKLLRRLQLYWLSCACLAGSCCCSRQYVRFALTFDQELPLRVYCTLRTCQSNLLTCGKRAVAEPEATLLLHSAYLGTLLTTAFGLTDDVPFVHWFGPKRSPSPGLVCAVGLFGRLPSGSRTVVIAACGRLASRRNSRLSTAPGVPLGGIGCLRTGGTLVTPFGQHIACVWTCCCSLVRP